MNKKEQQIIALEDNIIVEAFIHCEECLEKKYLNELDPEQDAYIHGWRVVDDRVLCPTCIRLSKHQPIKKKK